VPAPDDLRSNGCAAAPKETELTARERKIYAQLGPALREQACVHHRRDDGYLTEINVTSPTGIRAIKNLGGPDGKALIWDKIEASTVRPRVPFSGAGRALGLLRSCVDGRGDGPFFYDGLFNKSRCAIEELLQSFRKLLQIIA
jgi:hypothetical protein